jgi:hypothetical protein
LVSMGAWRWVMRGRKGGGEGGMEGPAKVYQGGSFGHIYVEETKARHRR